MTIQKQFNHAKTKQILNDQGRKQSWLAAQIHLSPAYVTLLLNGAREPSAGTVKLMALALGVPEDDLFF